MIGVRVSSAAALLALLLVTAVAALALSVQGHWAAPRWGRFGSFVDGSTSTAGLTVAGTHLRRLGLGSTEEATPQGSPTPTPRPAAPAPPLTGYQSENPRLALPSNATVFTFYMYRVQNDQDYPPENQNMANLPGALWYLHNEIVNNLGERRFKKTRIQRFLVKTKATQPLADSGMNFGVRYAFDAGQCTGPFDCAKQWNKYGYVVGCNHVDRFPTQQWRHQVFYASATWYSLPGPCNSKPYNQHDEACLHVEPGGACDDPTGQGNCTYGYRHAGEITIDDLEGLENLADFVQHGGLEYNNTADKGVNMTFWDDKFNATACSRRVRKADRLFAKKYPTMPPDADMPAPTCDFKYDAFYAGDIPESWELHR